MSCLSWPLGPSTAPCSSSNPHSRWSLIVFGFTPRLLPTAAPIRPPVTPAASPAADVVGERVTLHTDLAWLSGIAGSGSARSSYTSRRSRSAAGRWDDAAAECRRAIAIHELATGRDDPTIADLWQRLANAERGAGREEAAQIADARARELAPK